jgi:methyltransferase (TIGR00027 family)
VADEKIAPERTAARVALWRAMHLLVDPPPHLLKDEVGLALLAPSPNWRRLPAMDPHLTIRLRASMLARARFIEDIVVEQARLGVEQYIILGAGLDTFAQRQPDIASRLKVFEIDQPGPQAWKRQRLIDLGLGIPDWLRFVAVDFERGASWWEQLANAGFDPDRPAVVASSGVSMYLTREANAAALRQLAALARGSTLAMTFNLPLELVEPLDRPVAQQMAKAGSRFVSFFSPAEMLAFAREAGFRTVEHVSAADLAELYFAGRTDGLRPSSLEDLIVATT